MLNKELAISVLAILIVIIFLTVSYFLLIWPLTKNQNNILNFDQSNSGQSEQFAKIGRALKSKVVRTIIASGKVTNIFGRIITITDQGDSISISAKENTQVYFIEFVSKQGKTASQQTKSDFSNIKIGDQISAIIKITENGGIEAVSIIIYSTTAK